LTDTPARVSEIVTAREHRDVVGPALAVQSLTKRFGAVTAVENVSFTVPGGAFLSLLGPSGSGKTTISRLLSGFETLDSGRIDVGGEDISDLPPFRRDIGVVFQRYALFPHMSVAQNVAFSLKQRGMSKHERDLRVAEMLEIVGLHGYGERSPGQLSGGQQQRVALARALVFKPRILVMDEPLAALDKRLREHLQQEIRSLQRRLGITTLYVTHDQAEAFAMSDMVAVMNAGRIEQIGTPRDLYEAPRTEFVARFVGDSNVFSGARVADGLQVAGDAVLRGRSQAFAHSFLVRPEKITVQTAPPAAGDVNTLRGEISSVIFLGEVLEYKVAAAGQIVSVRTHNRAAQKFYTPGDSVWLSWAVADTVPL
jgi:putative spermidine/putrescine transport system ATP-binding protein